jgi:hypothetical protein
VRAAAVSDSGLFVACFRCRIAMAPHKVGEALL